MCVVVVDGGASAYGGSIPSLPTNFQMSTTHKDHHYSITYHSNDLAVVGCLRALSQHCQRTGNARITWGNTSKEDWRASGNKVTFHFSHPSYREALIAEAERILPTSLFSVVSQRDDHPATPANRK